MKFSATWWAVQGGVPADALVVVVDVAVAVGAVVVDCGAVVA
jgi:hypothetical protein